MRLAVLPQPLEFDSGDFDGDGRADLAVLGSSRLSLFAGRGHGELVWQGILPGQFGGLMRAGDMDRDGRDDLLFVSTPFGGSPAITVHYAAAEWRFDLGTRVVLPELDLALSLLLVDLDGDADLDVVTAGYSARRVFVLENAGSRSLRVWSILPVGNEPLDVQAGDLDGDGIPDLLVANAGFFTSYRGLGDGGFEKADRVLLRIGEPRLADADGDGDLDLFGILQEAVPSELAIFVNDGAARFTLSVAYPLEPRQGDLAARDVDGDGAADVVVANTDTDEGMLFLSGAGGTLRPPIRLETGEEPRSWLLEDLDGDGDREIAVASGHSDFVTVWRNVPIAGKPDCNGDGIPDPCEVELGLSEDCNGNLLPDSCDVAPSLGLSRRRAVAAMAGAVDIALADMDGDSDADLVAIVRRDRRPTQIAVYPNDGIGWFGEPELLEDTHHAREIAAADLDGDGGQDIAALVMGCSDCQVARILVLLNTGVGAFRQSSWIETDSSQARGLLACDVDGDRDVDLLAVVGNRVALFRSLGAGAFAPAVFPEVDEGAIALGAGDIDGDGLAELITGYGRPGRIAVLRGTPEGFVPMGTHAVRDLVNGVAAADVDGDGDTDVVATHSIGTPEDSDATLSVLRNMGSGSLSAPLTTAAGPGGKEVITGNFDRSGGADLAVLGQAGVSIVLPDSTGMLRLAGIFAAEATAAVIGAAVGDVDGDGADDFAVATTRTREILVLLNDGTGDFPGPQALPAGESPAALAAGDVDGDGDIDLVSGGEGMRNEGALRVHSNDGRGRFAEVGLVPFPDAVSWVGLVDMDGDGDLDAIDASPRLSRNDGAGRFAASEAVTPSRPRGARGRPVVEDFNGDGLADLAFAVGTSGGPPGAHVFLNDGSGVVYRETHYAFGKKSVSRLIAVDLEGDRDPDLVATADNTVLLLVNEGDGSFTSGGRLFPESLAWRTVLGFAAGDVDRDGDEDIFLGVSENAVVHFENDGTGKFPHWTLLHIPSPTGSALLDFDADGRVDFGVASLHSIAILRQTRDGTFGAPERIPAADETSSLVSADFDADGRGDLAWVQVRSQSIAVLLNASTEALEPDGDGNGIPDVCEGVSFHRGDANGDGLLSVADAMYVIAHRFHAGPPPACRNAGNANGDRRLDVGDAVFVLSFLFRGGPPPPEPGPPGGPCGRDPAPAGSPRDLGCAEYDAC